MAHIKKLGIWMDNAAAHLTEYTNGEMTTHIIDSDYNREVELETIEKSENVKNNKEQHMRTAYYKKIKEVIAQYNEVILFGATNAKNELYNILKEDNRFANIRIDVKTANKMSPNQEHAYVRDYFSKQNLSL